MSEIRMQMYSIHHIMMFKHLRWVWFGLLLLMAAHVSAQRVLVFEQYRWNKVIRHKFFSGNELHVKLYGGEHVKGTLSSLQDSLLAIDDRLIPLKGIKKIYRKRAAMEVVAGLSYYAFFLTAAIPVTNGLINNDDLSQPNVMIPAVASSAALIITSAIANTRRGFRIRDRNKLRIFYWG